MANLWFENREGKERLIANVDNWHDVYYCIDEFIKQCNEGRPEEVQFKSYYKRMWEQNDRTKIDVGSWSEFFYTDLKMEEITNAE